MFRIKGRNVFNLSVPFLSRASLSYQNSPVVVSYLVTITMGRSALYHVSDSIGLIVVFACCCPTLAAVVSPQMYCYRLQIKKEC